MWQKIMRRIFSRSKPKIQASELEFAFKDLDGLKYYRIPAQLALPIERFGKLQENLMWQSAGMTAQELTALIEVGEGEMENLVQGKKGKLSVVGAVFQEMKMRSQLVLHTELLYNYVGILYIREDEDPQVFSQAIQDEKVEAFKKMVGEGSSYEFFQIPELRRANELLSLLQQEWEELWTASVREQHRLKKMIEYLRSELKFASTKKTSEVS